MVPKQTSKIEARHGGAEKRRAIGEPADRRTAPQNFPRERPGSWDFEETTPAEFYGRQVIIEETNCFLISLRYEFVFDRSHLETFFKGCMSLHLPCI